MNFFNLDTLFFFFAVSACTAEMLMLTCPAWKKIRNVSKYTKITTVVFLVLHVVNIQVIPVYIHFHATCVISIPLLKQGNKRITTCYIKTIYHISNPKRFYICNHWILCFFPFKIKLYSFCPFFFYQ